MFFLSICSTFSISFFWGDVFLLTCGSCTPLPGELWLDHHVEPLDIPESHWDEPPFFLQKLTKISPNIPWCMARNFTQSIKEFIYMFEYVLSCKRRSFRGWISPIWSTTKWGVCGHGNMDLVARNLYPSKKTWRTHEVGGKTGRFF